MSKNSLLNRISPIEGEELNEWFEKHLPYRLDALTAHTRYFHYGSHYFSKVDAQALSDIQICTIEMGILSCRKFMEFLGLKVSYINSNKQLKENIKYYEASENKSVSYEVKIKDLGGKFVKLNTLSNEQIDLLTKIYVMAHRTTAHTTTGSNDQGDTDYFHQAVMLVEHLVKTHLYDVVGREMPKGKTLCELYNISPDKLSTRPFIQTT